MEEVGDIEVYKLCSEVVERGNQIQEEQAIAERLHEELRLQDLRVEEQSAALVSELKRRDSHLLRLRSDVSQAQAQLKDTSFVLSTIGKSAKASTILPSKAAPTMMTGNGSPPEVRATDSLLARTPDPKLVLALQAELSKTMALANDREKLSRLYVLEGQSMASALQALLNNGAEADALLRAFSACPSDSGSESMVAKVAAITGNEQTAARDDLTLEARDLRGSIAKYVERSEVARQQQRDMEKDLAKQITQAKELRAELSNLEMHSNTSQPHDTRGSRA